MKRKYEIRCPARNSEEARENVAEGQRRVTQAFLDGDESKSRYLAGELWRVVFDAGRYLSSKTILNIENTVAYGMMEAPVA